MYRNTFEFRVRVRGRAGERRRCAYFMMLTSFIHPSTSALAAPVMSLITTLASIAGTVPV